MKKFLALFFLFLSSLSFAQGVDYSRLEALLDLDRFEAYTKAWASTMHGRGKVEIAEAIRKISPQEFAAMNLDGKKLKDAMNYDGLILQILKKTKPELKVTAVDVEWGYNFFKRKLNDAYTVSAVKPRAGPVVLPETIFREEMRSPIPLGTSSQNADEVLLDVGGYASDRTTRGVFWEASEANRTIELHVGSAGDFRNEMNLRGTTIIGEVDTKARNYNPIYLVQNPGEKSFQYAITEISGADRLRHFQLQTELVRWPNPTGKVAKPAPIIVVGDATSNLLDEEKTLTRVLNNIPRADHVVIGQKGAFERTFGSIGKVNSLLRMEEKNRAAMAAVLTANDMNLLDKAKVGNISEFVMKYASDIDKLYEEVKPLLEKNRLLSSSFTAFNYDRGSYEMSDFVMIGKNNQSQRWRIFSNVWGDEVLPIARALKKTKYNTLSYIGTAGALPGSGLKVGDLVIPLAATDTAGISYPIKHSSWLNPSDAKSVSMVVNVQSPFEETRDWLENVSKNAQAVEVETGYLASVFKDPKDRMNVMLLISDVVGSEDETLASASSSSRRKAQINGISEIITKAEVASTGVVRGNSGGLSQWISEIAPTRDPVSVLQIQREAHLRGINTKKDLETFIKTQKSFTVAKVEAAIQGADFRMARIIRGLDEAGILPKLSVANSFLDGRFNPTSGPVEIYIKAPSAKADGQIRKIIESLSANDPDFGKYLKVNIGTSASGKGFINVPGILNSDTPMLSSLYEDGLLRFGGLAQTENTNGGLKFVRVMEPALDAQLTTTAFFPPDDKTKSAMQVLKGNFSEIQSVLDKHVDDLNNDGKSLNFIVEWKKVPSLPNGSLAQIVPVLGKENIIVELRITSEGLKNPGVVAEEIIHLEQIIGFNDRYFFTHPYEWAETVANARAGSIRAIEKLTRMEVAAASDLTNVIENNASMLKQGYDQSKVKEFANARLTDAQARYTPVAKAAKIDAKKRQAAWNGMRETFDKLEAKGVKFNDLVMKNDRKGARAMLEKYLPWELMEPSETNAWKEFLEAMENPDPKKLEVVFRGMDDYPVLRTPGSDKVGMFSTVLTKNQGNYTRRLRSLTTMREKIGVHKSYGHGHEMMSKNNPSVLVMMENHAGDPMGSPFLSVSDHDIAAEFGRNERIALKVDERRLIPNAMAFNFDERERLIPLVVFPDEVIHYQGKGAGSNHYGIDDDEFLKKVEKKLGRKLKPDEINWKISEGDFLKKGYERIRPLLLDATELETIKGSGVCAIGSPCDCVYKTLDALLK